MSSAEHSVEAFKVGQVVKVKAREGVVGAIVERRLDGLEPRYVVLVNGREETYYHTQLEAFEASPDDPSPISLPGFHARLSALQIVHPSSSSLYSLNAARIDFVPYQFRPVLKFINSDRPRLLIADGVGVGKTIEAGLILRELQARGGARSALIICTKQLVVERKWELEMKRFDQRFAAIDSGGLRYCLRETYLDGLWPQRYAKAVIPYSLFSRETLFGTEGRRRKKGLLELDPPPRFDLLIVDEAHHVRNPATFAHRAVRFLCENSEAVLFLTATPIQMGSTDLFVLLRLLRPDLVIDEFSFEQMAGPNPFINKALDTARAGKVGWPKTACDALIQAGWTSWGREMLQDDPDYQSVLERLGSEVIPVPDRIGLIADMERLNTFSSIISRTRRRDIEAFTERRSYTVSIPFTCSQRKIYDRLLQIRRSILERLHGDRNVNFMMSMLRRQAASSIFALVPFVRAILERRLHELDLSETQEVRGKDSLSPGESVRQEIEALAADTEGLDRVDPKLDALRSILAEKQGLSNNKVMVFSTFRHTLRYLFGHLVEDGFRAGLIDGLTPDDERRELRDRFALGGKHRDALDVLLFSEVGTEGLDYQFCDCIVNYDLPWNPMRIEQRIGRIDRRGQQSDVVVIYNIVTPGTVDADIYERCLNRIGVFEGALGATDEILGEITREIEEIAEDFSLSEEERRARLERIAENKIRLIREQQELEEREAELFGIRVSRERAAEDVVSAANFWLSPSMLENLVSRYLSELFAGSQIPPKGKKSIKTIRLSREKRQRLLQDFRRLPADSSISAMEWREWLKGNDPVLRLAFRPDYSGTGSNVALLSAVHPLVKQAARHFQADGLFRTAVLVEDDQAPSGEYPFAVYQWIYCGIDDDLKLIPLCRSEEVEADLLNLLKTAEPIHDFAGGMSGRQVFDLLESRHHEMWARARALHRERVEKVARLKLKSLEKSHQARIRILEEQFRGSGSERIRRMMESRMERATREYEEKTREVKESSEKADIIAKPVAFGVIRVVSAAGPGSNER